MNNPPANASRVLSIDVFRGIIIFTMVFVNELAGVENVPQWMKHLPADVDGMTFVDLVFPAFLYTSAWKPHLLLLALRPWIDILYVLSATYLVTFALVVRSNTTIESIVVAAELAWQPGAPHDALFAPGLPVALPPDPVLGPLVLLLKDR